MKKVVLISLGLIGIITILLFTTVKNTTVDIENSLTIGILPFSKIPTTEVDSVMNAIEKMYEFKTVLLDEVDLPELAYTEIKYPRYRADSLVLWLRKNKPDSVDIIVGLTNKDISITKYDEVTRKIKKPEWKYNDFGIFGLGQVGGVSCVVSSNRLHKNVSDNKFNTRLIRIACHEVGHVFGLRHCPKPKCLMNDANESIKTIDKSTGVLCADCKAKIN